MRKPPKKHTNPVDVGDETIVNAIHELIKQCGEAPNTYEGDLTTQLIQTSLKLMVENHDIGQLKLINRALKEMRHAYRIFNQYPDQRCISIFGSARTPFHHPDYRAAESFSKSMAKDGWMCITGAAAGIMHAGIKGAQRESSFGLSIHLPFEVTSNELIKEDPKLMVFRYFFTRKLMFISHADAIAAFPGGVGTLDELFEVLTLMQTGKSHIVPLVLIEGAKGSYWNHWNHYIETQLLANKWICEADMNFFYIASSPAQAKRHIMKFYRRYHSSRYVKDDLVIRMLTPLKQKQIDQLNEQFAPLISEGKITMGGPLPEETEYLELPRLIFKHTRKRYGLLRVLIDQINQF